MQVLPDGTYDVLVVDAAEAGDDELALELVLTSGSHKGEVVRLRAAHLGRDSLDLLGMPGTMQVTNGVPSLELER